MAKNGPYDRQLDRLERILERCIEADRQRRKERRANPDFFYQEFQAIAESHKRREEEKRKRSGTQDEES